MKRILFALAAAGLIVSSLQAQEKLEFKSDLQKSSYAGGVALGRQWKQRGMDLDLDIVMRGIKDAIAGKELQLTDAELNTAWTSYTRELTQRAAEKQKAEAEKNRAEGDKFLSENKTKPGVITLPSGLQYKVLQEGSGPNPAPTNNVVVNYRGKLINGTEFDSSYKRGQPATFLAMQVIKGWSEALQLMKVGSKWELFIPADLAYGDRGAGQNIPPGSTLLFEVELLEIKAPVNPVAAPVVTSDIIKVPSKEEMDKGAKIEIIKPQDLPKK